MIIDHPSRKYSGEFGPLPCKVIQCDFCQRLAPPGTDMHAAVGKAHSAAFITVRNGTVMDPRLWSCPSCTQRRLNQQ